jgi:hypothetical protein
VVLGRMGGWGIIIPIALWLSDGTIRDVIKAEKRQPSDFTFLLRHEKE